MKYALALIALLAAAPCRALTDQYTWDPAKELNKQGDWGAVLFGKNDKAIFYKNTPVLQPADAGDYSYSVPLFVPNVTDDKKDVIATTLDTDRRLEVKTNKQGAPIKYAVYSISKKALTPLDAGTQIGTLFAIKGIHKLDPKKAVTVNTPANAPKKEQPDPQTKEPEKKTGLTAFEKSLLDKFPKKTSDDAAAKCAGADLAACRAALKARATTYGAPGDADALTKEEWDFIGAHTGDEAKSLREAYPTLAVQDQKAFRKSYRDAISRELADYAKASEPGQFDPSATGAYVPALVKTAPSKLSDVDADLAKLFSEASPKKAAALRSILKTLAENNPDLKAKIKDAAQKAGTIDPGLKQLMDELRDGIAKKIANPKATGLKLGLDKAAVDDKTMLAAYCAPTGGAPTGVKTKDTKTLDAGKNIEAGKTGFDDAHTSVPGSGPNPADGPLAKQCQDYRNAANVDEANTHGGPNGGLVTKPVPSVNDTSKVATIDPQGKEKKKDEKGGKDDGDCKNDGTSCEKSDAGDPNFADHMRTGAVFGGFFGLGGMLLGLLFGGPIGLLVVGGLSIVGGFGLGYGLDKLTNSGG